MIYLINSVISASEGYIAKMAIFGMDSISQTCTENGWFDDRKPPHAHFLKKLSFYVVLSQTKLVWGQLGVAGHNRNTFEDFRAL